MSFEFSNQTTIILKQFFPKLDDKTIAKLQEFIALHDLEPNDAIVSVLVTQFLYHESAKAVPEILRELCQEIKVHLVTLQSQSAGKIQECRDVAYDIKVAGNRISKQLARTQTTPSPIVPFLWAFFGSILGSGIVLGLTHYLSQ
jgi:hypothetical protein